MPETAAPTQRRPVWSRLLRAVLGVAGLYLLLCLALFLFGDALLFRAPRASYRDDGRILKLRAADGARISARYLPSPGARYTLLFSHGQGDDLGTIAPFLERLHDWGYAVLAYDYHGYGTSEGRGSEAHAYQDIDAAYDYLTRQQHVPPARIIAYGYSLGSGPTVDLAARRPVGGMVLDSAFTSVGRVFAPARLLPYDAFRNREKIARVTCPVLIIHRRDDRVVRFSQGQALYQAAHAPKQNYWAERGGHTAIYRETDPQYEQRLTTFRDLLERTR